MKWGPDYKGEQSFVCSEVSKSYYHYLEKKRVLGVGCSNDVFAVFEFNWWERHARMWHASTCEL